MPQQDKAHGSATLSLEGRTFTPVTDAELSAALDKAFDYRGDVTLGLKDGRLLVGFLSNRDAKTRKLEFFPADKTDPAMKTLDYSDIASVAFTGEDTAFGKSWEEWMSKKADERNAEAEKVRVESLARGEL